MRIISGAYRGRKIHPPTNLPVRPTTDYAKEGLFNVLNNLIDFEETSVLDLFAGTGNITFEFVSRGVPAVLAIDIERRCVEFISQTAERLGMEEISVRRMNVNVFLRQAYQKFDLVFADPPYVMEGIELLPEQILEADIMNPGGILVLEHSDRYNFTDNPCFDQLREYGKVLFSMFRKPRDAQYSSS